MVKVFLLNYIDDVKLRQRIKKQLNKVESSNKFSKAGLKINVVSKRLKEETECLKAS